MYSMTHLLSHLSRSQTDLVIDVGANRGQFALHLFKAGFLGTIISFEPLSEAHRKLEHAASRTPNWEIAARCAIGAKASEAVINVAGNSESSSMRPMLERHLAAAPHSAYVSCETVQMRTLADFISARFPNNIPRFALKIDTQGYEDEVIDGLGNYIRECTMVLLEMPLSPLYAGASDLPKLFTRLVKAGFHCVGLSPGYADPWTGDAIEVDGLFVRDPSTARPLNPSFSAIDAETELAAIKRSTAWRVTYPLRLVINAFRKARQ